MSNRHLTIVVSSHAKGFGQSTDIVPRKVVEEGGRDTDFASRLSVRLGNARHDGTRKEIGHLGLTQGMTRLMIVVARKQRQGEARQTAIKSQSKNSTTPLMTERFFDTSFSYLARNFTVLHVTVRILQRVVDPTLGHLAKRVDKRLNLIGLSVRYGEDGMGILVERMNDFHGRLGLRPFSVTQVLDRVRLSSST